MMRTALRQLARAPGFTITTIASLALAVGANATIFSVVSALWLRPLPVQDPDRLVVPYYPVVHSTDGELLDTVQLPAARALQDLEAFEAMTYELSAATRLGDWRPVLRPKPGADAIPTVAVAANYFDVLGVHVTGRTFADAEDTRGADPVAVVSGRLWRRTAGDRPFTPGVSLATVLGAIPVVGVAPPGFHGPRLGDGIDLWITIGALGRVSEFASEPGMERLTPVTVFARLRPGTTREAAEAEIRSVLNPRSSLRVLRDVAFPLRSEGGLSRQRSLVQTLAAAALLVLVLGCANLAALFTARAVTRRRDMAVRLSLGASRWHLARIVVAEASVLSIGGLLTGLLFREWLLRGIAVLETSAGLAVASLDTRLDWRVLAAAAVTVIAAAGLAAGGAAHRASRTEITPLVAGGSFSGTRRDRRMRQALLATHTALAVALLVAATALVAIVTRAMTSPEAFARNDLIVASVRPRFLQYMDAEEGVARLREDYAAVLRRLESLPFIEAATQGDPPLRPRTSNEPTPIRVDDRVIRTPLMRLEGGSGYLTALGARLLEGRDFTAADIAESVEPREMMRYLALRRLPRFSEPPPRGGRAVAVIDQTLASLLWPDGGAIGRSFTWTPFEISYTVVGITAPLGHHPRSPHVVPAMIAPQKLATVDLVQPFRFVSRTGEDTSRANLGAVAALLRDAFPDAPILEVNTAAGLVEIEMAQERTGARIFGYYALAAVLLGFAGVYGTVSFLVRQSRRECAVRYALGASEQALARMTLLRVLIPVAVGAAAGAALSQAFGAALAARVVGLGNIPLWMSCLAAFGFCVVSLVVGLAAWAGIRSGGAAESLKAA